MLHVPLSSKRLLCLARSVHLPTSSKLQPLLAGAKLDLPDYVNLVGGQPQRAAFT